MGGTVTEFTLVGRRCACLRPEHFKGTLPLCVLCGWGLAEQLSDLAEGLPGMLLFWAEMEGGRDCTPWPAPPVWAEEQFTGEAEEYLRFFTEEALPFLQREFGASPDPERRALLGYSLGGLFALWAMGQTDAFRTYGSLSGSVWYDGFLEHLEKTPLKGDEHVYLSLGDREEFGGPPRIRAVGDCTRKAAELLSARLSDTVLEWNRGGHGKGVQTRWKRALSWTAKRIKGEMGA